MDVCCHATYFHFTTMMTLIKDKALATVAQFSMPF